MSWLSLGIVVMLFPALALCVFVVWLHFYVCRQFLDKFVRIFQEKPLFIIPHGQPVKGTEEVLLRTRDGLTLRGVYLRTRIPRKGVILFGLEFGSNRWSCISYCQSLLLAGYDVFTYEPRNQGDSDVDPRYEPLQWATRHDLLDMEAAIEYLKQRPDADLNGIGIFGVSKGASVGLYAASKDPFVRCVVTDGAFATYSTMVPYMRKWIEIYAGKNYIPGMFPAWYYGLVGIRGLWRVEHQRHVRFLNLEKALNSLEQPLLMIHGGGDTYIKVEMGKALFTRAKGPKDFWIVPNAKHNQAIFIAGEEYHRRICEFFDRFLAAPESADVSAFATNRTLTAPSSDAAVGVY